MVKGNNVLWERMGKQFPESALPTWRVVSEKKETKPPSGFLLNDVGVWIEDELIKCVETLLIIRDSKHLEK